MAVAESAAPVAAPGMAARATGINSVAQPLKRRATPVRRVLAQPGAAVRRSVTGPCMALLGVRGGLT